MRDLYYINRDADITYKPYRWRRSKKPRKGSVVYSRKEDLFYHVNQNPTAAVYIYHFLIFFAALLAPGYFDEQTNSVPTIPLSMLEICAVGFLYAIIIIPASVALVQGLMRRSIKGAKTVEAELIFSWDFMHKHPTMQGVGGTASLAFTFMTLMLLLIYGEHKAGMASAKWYVVQFISAAVSVAAILLVKGNDNAVMMQAKSKVWRSNHEQLTQKTDNKFDE